MVAVWFNQVYGRYVYKNIKRKFENRHRSKTGDGYCNDQ